MRNIEIKARVESLDGLHPLARELSGAPPELIKQEDVFFYCESGRLKLRIFSESEGQLIYYRRVDTPGPKTSYYDIAPVDHPGQLRQVLSAAYGIRGVVRKTRWLYRIDHTRLHLDEVEHLGCFIELEVVLRPEQPPDDGHVIAERLLNLLQIHQEDLVPFAYIDLLEARG